MYSPSFMSAGIDRPPLTLSAGPAATSPPFLPAGVGVPFLGGVAPFSPFFGGVLAVSLGIGSSIGAGGGAGVVSVLGGAGGAGAGFFRKSSFFASASSFSRFSRATFSTSAF